ncbi:hypothetical protein LXM25_05750 [Dyadobacter sp. LJ53]|uniref:hypothetical protein n=1 Tax=Dyadobacter chenwenxiniae TaxID=2906456 RepID=UPI001F24A22F|nr:hypothetical protein [Dyadobacter chenwenxiniae]MCF0049547.1 hypothetical protein [Dyadobacter chenwenxiniae]
MFYSAIIELVGLKEYAEDNPAIFNNTVKEFKETIHSTFTLYFDHYESYKNTDFEVYIYRDYSYFQCSDFDKLVNYIILLQSRFFEAQSYFFRSVVIKGRLNLNHTPNPKSTIFNVNNQVLVNSFGLSEIPTRLYGMMERFKGVGILVDEQIVSNLHDQSKTFTNYYVTELLSRKLESFQDISFLNDNSLFYSLKKILEIISESRNMSKKLARFYIPLLINIAKNYNYSLENKLPSLTSLVGKGTLNKLRTIHGIELFYCAIIDSIFNEEDRISKSENLVNNIQDFLKSHLSGFQASALSNEHKSIVSAMYEEKFGKRLEIDTQVVEKEVKKLIQYLRLESKQIIKEKIIVVRRIIELADGVNRQEWILDILRGDSKLDIPKDIISLTTKRRALRRFGKIYTSELPKSGETKNVMVKHTDK